MTTVITPTQRFRVGDTVPVSGTYAVFDATGTKLPMKVVHSKDAKFLPVEGNPHVLFALLELIYHAYTSASSAQVISTTTSTYEILIGKLADK